MTAEDRARRWIGWWLAHFTAAELAAHQRIVDEHRAAVDDRPK